MIILTLLWLILLYLLRLTDQYAENYNSNATVDDGSCSGYPDNGDACYNLWNRLNG